MISQKNLFLRQSYLDSYAEYEKSLKREKYPVWDYVILTASNKDQAESYTKQIEYRIKKGKLPKRTHYAVIPDEGGKRVGSGGATLSVMKYIREIEPDFKGKKILVIHSGGDSKRVPQYSACGKLFSPIPRAFKDGTRSTIFDEFIIGLTGVPARISDGMLVCSGDVLLLFNPLQIDFYTKGAAALSIKENVETGKNHGVFLGDNKGNVGKFLHKQTVTALKKNGAVDQRDNVDIDTGAVIFESNLLNDLYSLVDTEEKYKAFVNEKVRLSFYADFLYPLASESTLEGYYKETPEGDFSPELKECRTLIWEKLHKYSMKLLRFSPASFVHFGTSRELLNLMTEEMPAYSFLDWSGNINTNSKSKNFASSNSYISPKCKVGDGSYIEDSYIHKDTRVGKNCIISCVTLNGEKIKDGTVLHGLKLKDGKFVCRMYGVLDNPKESKFFGKELDEPLWTKKLYPVCDSISEAVNKTLNGEKTDNMLSLEESFNLADASAILQWQEKMQDRTKVETLLEAIAKRQSIDSVKGLFETGISPYAEKLLLEKISRRDISNLEDFGTVIRIYFFMANLINDNKKQEKYRNECFLTISKSMTTVAEHKVEYMQNAKIVKDDVTVNLPVRVNFGGGWSDTPPYCLENGGTVFNAAITLNGQCPIEVIAKKLPEKKVVLTSGDIGSYGEFTDIEPLLECNNPGDPFALHKAALIACGVFPLKGGVTLQEILDRLGGGIYLSTQVYNIPKGSGLGTSSILSGACVKAIHELLGIDAPLNELYNKVSCMEQLMSTGGGWQDQVGGLSGGLKMSSSTPGIYQDIKCNEVKLSKETLKKLNDRFAVIYTGQRRLARNLLREVVGKYIGGNKDTIDAIYEVQRIAVLMKFELEKGNIDGFCKLLNAQWELAQKIDAGCTNTCIDQIFDSIEDLIDAKMICGAGGGGFLQVVVKEGVTVKDLKKRLTSVFADSGVDVWKSDFKMD